MIFEQSFASDTGWPHSGLIPLNALYRAPNEH